MSQRRTDVPRVERGKDDANGKEVVVLVEGHVGVVFCVSVSTAGGCCVKSHNVVDRRRIVP